MLFCHLHVKKKKKKVYYKYIKIGFSGANNKSMLIGLAFTALQLLNVPLKTRENSKWIFTKYNTISLKVNTAQRGLPSLSPSCLFYLFIIAKKKKDPRQKRLWTYFIKCKLLFFSLCQVANPGQALQTLGSAFLNIMWPYELANEKWLLYPASLTFQGHPETQCSPTSALNPLKLQGSSPAELGSHGVGGASHCRLWTGSFVYTYTQKYICWL